ncbi:MAG: STY4528 family pathogenicity island replication protein [Candidatus Thiodiazotropha endolucinida]|nr:STY4528 family pathogenicity island replication protein [Candidatus Thiodiazotropha taylori]MCW4349695.1 STY4528 family pathogenicity island replication protein [Candidatus Thiodiazotropha endolucinida]
MNEMPGSLRPETLALDALIREIIAKVEASEGEGTSDRMVFLGNRHQSFPTAVIKDRVLEPVDKVVWMVIMLAVRETGGDTAFPGYDAIGQMANVSSRSTIARAIAILRATRWLSLCARVRRATGRFHGNVYALHDEPVPLVDALHLDADYMTFLGSATGHGHARVRAVAQSVLDSIDEDIESGRAICGQEHPIERRLESRAVREDGHPRRFFSFTRNVVRQLHAKSGELQQGQVSHDQISNSAKSRVRNSSVQISNSSSCSSYINKTTTTHTAVSSNFVVTGEGDQPLVYPKRLCDNHREIAARYLSALAPEQRQPILDELEGRFRAETKGMKPVYDEISFLHSLCKLTRQGKFQPNLGIKVRDGRRAGKRLECKGPATNPARSSKETDEQRQKRKAASQAHIAEMRSLLGMSDKTEKQ